MTTDNRTNEQIADDALATSGFLDGQHRADVASFLVNEFTAAGRLVTQKQNGILPNFACTDEQVEAAAKALYEYETGLGADSWGRAFEVERSLWRDQGRAALVAAQGAAPQAPVLWPLI